MSRPDTLLTGRSEAFWLLSLAGVGVFIGAADQTSVVTVLPKMITGVGLAQDQFYRAAWIVNAYILGYIVAMPLMGRIADNFGHGKVFALSLLLFCAGSAWVALSNELTMLSIARAVQAVGGGAVVPVSLAIVATKASPARRAMGLGAMAAASEAGGLIGPLWGGAITELIGWRGVFWINLPLCLPIALAIWRLSRDESRLGRGAIDFLGAALLGGSLICLTVALTDDPIQRRVLAETLALYGGAAALFGLFILRQLRAAAPLVDLSLFRRASPSAAFIVNGLAGGALIVAMVNIPLFTNVILGGSALSGGLHLMRLTLALAVGALAGGVLANRIGLAAGAAIGLACSGVGFLAMSRWSEDPSFVAMTLPLLIGGLGFGLVISPVATAVLEAVDESARATAASLLTVMRLLGALVGVALLTTRGLSGFYAQAGLIPLDDPRFTDLLRGLQVDSFRHAFLGAAVICLLGLIPAAMLRRATSSK